jgi:hypothetical protein
MPERASAGYRSLKEAQLLQIRQDERRWIERFAEPDHPAQIVLNFGCGVQYTPHLMLETVGVLAALDVDFVAVAGPAWCCGQPYVEDGQRESGMNMAANSSRRMAAFEPQTTVHWCGAWWPQLDAAFSDTAAPIELEHISAFMARVLRDREIAIPWQAEVYGRALVHLKARDSSQFADRGAVVGSMEAGVPFALETIPGLEVVGDAPIPVLGAPCAMADGRSVLAGLGAPEVAAVRSELVGAARELGGNLIVTPHQACHREWGKFASDELPIRHFISLLAEALGVSEPDRFHAYWRLADPEAVVERARPAWESWGLSATEAMRIASELFPTSP